MMTPKIIFIGVFAFWIETGLVSSQDQTAAELYKQCVYLNSVRANYTICCHYPIMQLYGSEWHHCHDLCLIESSDETSQIYNCCMRKCCYEIMGLIYFTKSDNGTDVPNLSSDAMIAAYMISVGNDTSWAPVVSASIIRCFDQYSTGDDRLDCDVIPWSLYDVWHCVYKENYLKCPTWNPNNIPECEMTHQYVDKCLNK